MLGESSSPILVTGAAGFIGFHVVRRLLNQGNTVVGIDNLNNYYDSALKRARLAELHKFSTFRFEKIDIADRERTAALFAREKAPLVIHLAAQAGVRHSLVDPSAYIDSNLVGFGNVLEGCRRTGCQHLLYASSSSVYGSNTAIPFMVSQNVDHPVNLYGATKKANELMAHAYAHLFSIPTTGLRFFTVYGPWGRPDMAMWLFANAIISGKPLRLFNHGHLQRDFTFVDDVVEAIVRLLVRPAASDATWSGEAPNPATSLAPWRVFNIGNHMPVKITEVVRLLESELGRKANIELVPMQPGDIMQTYAEVSDLEAAIGFRPRTSISEGVHRFVAWYRSYVT